MRNKYMLDTLRLTLCSLFTAPGPPIIWVRTTSRLLEACLRNAMHRARAAQQPKRPRTLTSCLRSGNHQLFQQRRRTAAPKGR